MIGVALFLRSLHGLHLPFHYVRMNIPFALFQFMYRLSPLLFVGLQKFRFEWVGLVLAMMKCAGACGMFV